MSKVGSASFSAGDAISKWLAICCCSGVPDLSTGSLNLILSQEENLLLF